MSNSDAREHMRLKAVDIEEPNDNSKLNTQNAKAEDETEAPPDLRGDRGSIALLLILYMLQSVPLGLSAAIPMMLQKRGASYQTQAKFSMVWWPFTLKLLWAPIVDSCFSSRFGRRKSWLVPVQFLIGCSMITLSLFIDGWLGDSKTEMNVAMLGIMFFSLTFMAATQDIAVDGWSLTMLKRRNLGYASVCNNVGNAIGYYFGYALLVSLESAEFCNTYLRSEPHDEGMWTLAGIFYKYLFMTFMLPS